jgi:hypothetical protein
MAYMNVEHKRKIAELVKPILNKYGVKGTVAIRHHSTLVLNISGGKLDFIGNFNEVGEKSHGYIGFTPVNGNIRVNEFYVDRDYSGEVQSFLKEIISVMNIDNWNHSDIQSDYFNVGYYIDINIGKWDKPYALNN